MTMISVKDIKQALESTARQLNLLFTSNNKRKMSHLPMKRGLKNLRGFNEQRIQTLRELNLPDSCFYCKGLGFNCYSCEKYIDKK